MTERNLTIRARLFNPAKRADPSRPQEWEAASVTRAFRALKYRLWES